MTQTNVSVMPSATPAGSDPAAGKAWAERIKELAEQRNAVILAHNHPSGSPEPSKADRLITERVIKCCRFMDIRVLDHLVIGRGAYVSFAERGWI